ncbi:MAG: hypothetical protein J1E39_01520 [Eubacterium sp.]|nr:hypothetical protein [Eubacterium sp.]
MEQLLQKVSEAIQEDFVGNCVFSDDELAIMYDFTGNLLRNYDSGWGNSISQGYDQLVFVAMVNAVKTWKSDEDTFWDCIYKKLIGTSGSQKIYIYLTSVIERLGKNGKIIYLSGCTKRYYATILAHSFAPISSTESFLELCWNLYSEDMNFTYNKNDEIFSLVSEELRRTFLNEKSIEDDLRLGSGVYSLRAGIKRMTIDAPDKMVQFIENTICLLDRVFSGEILDSNLYYNSIVRNWWKDKEKSFGIEKPKRNTYDRAITDYTTIRPKYNFNGKQAVLTIPSIRLKSNFYVSPILNVYRGEELIDQRELDTFGTGLTMATKELPIYADNLVSMGGDLDCTIEIVHCGESIYNSKKTLFRDYLLFKDKREILQEECFPGNYILFAPGFDRFSSYPKSIKRMPGEPNLYVFNATEDEILQSEKRTVFFVNEKQNRSIRIVSDRKNNAKFIHDGEEYFVIDGDLKVIVNTDLDISKYGIRYEESDFKLKDFTCIEGEGIRTFLITELLNVCEPQKINIFSYIDNRIEASFNVVKFNRISIVYDKVLYFDKNNIGTVHFSTEKYNKEVSFDIYQGDVIIPFDDGDIVLTPPVLRWRIDDGEPSMQFGDGLWYKSISNSAMLQIDLPPELGYQVFTNNNVFLTEGSELNSFKFGELLYSMLQQSGEVTVFVKIENNNIVYPVLNVCLQEKFRYAPFEIVGRELIWNSSQAFIGDDNARFYISFLEKGTVVHSFEVENQSMKYSLNDLEIGCYDVTVELVKRIAFANKQIKLYECSITYGDINIIRFKGKYLRFEKVMLTGASNYEPIKTFYVDHLWYIGEIEGCHYYTGSAYIINRDGRKVYLNTMANDKGIFESTNPIRLELRSENSCFIVAGVNRDDMDDFLGEFTLDTRNCISNLDKTTRGIDYFVFEKEEA